MVFFHGGSFVSGSADENFLHPNNFMNEEVILVVPNYRLGIFGKTPLRKKEQSFNKNHLRIFAI